MAEESEESLDRKLHQMYTLIKDKYTVEHKQLNTF